MTLRQDYGLPPAGNAPSPARLWVVMGALVLVVLLGGLIIAGSPVFIVVLAVLVIAIVGFGIFRVLSARALREAPPERRVPPR